MNRIMKYRLQIVLPSWINYQKYHWCISEKVKNPTLNPEEHRVCLWTVGWLLYSWYPKIRMFATWSSKDCNWSTYLPWKLATWPFFIAWNRSHEVFNENKLPYICSMYYTGFNVLSMKINSRYYRHRYYSLITVIKYYPQSHQYRPVTILAASGCKHSNFWVSQIQQSSHSSQAYSNISKIYVL
jgi:hypothetical protein